MQSDVQKWSEIHAPVAVILAGGSGTRLWPLSRKALPKHFAPLLGARSLFQQTLLRLARALPAAPRVVVAAEVQAEALRAQLAELDLPGETVLVLEPVGRNTAAAVAMAARTVAEHWDARRVMWVCPSDHLVRRPAVLERAFELARPVVGEGYIATFGIAPDRPETGFGWIEVGEARVRTGDLALHRVERFVEKPDAATARRLLESGRHVWNSGMFVMRADVLLEELALHAPAIAAALEPAWAAREEDAGLVRLPTAPYARIPAAPVDKAVMEKSSRMVVVPCDPGWSDLGSFRALFDVAEKDVAGIAAAGPVVAVESRDCLVRTAERPVALAGVAGLAVIDAGDAVLVADLDAAEAVRGVVARLEAEGRPEAERPPRERCAWGARRRLPGGPGYRLDELAVAPGAALFLTAEPRVRRLVVAGRGRLECDGTPPVELGPGRLLSPSAGPCRLVNTGEAPLLVLEIVCEPVEVEV